MKRLIIVVLCLSGNAMAWTQWTAGGSDDLWINGDNWSTATCPWHTGESANFNTSGAALITSAMPAGYPQSYLMANSIRSDQSGSFTMTMTGGELRLSNEFWMRAGAGSGMFDLVMQDGVLSQGVAPGSTATLRVGGGAGGSSSHIQLDGGTINTTDLDLQSNGTIDIEDGTLTIAGDVTTMIQGHIDSGKITAFDGMGQVVVGYDGSKTTVTGTIPVKAHSPYPYTGLDPIPTDINLNWLAGANATGHEVYFGGDYDEVTQANRPAGDVDRDGDVDIYDLQLVAGDWIGMPTSLRDYTELSGDEIVNHNDFAVMAKDWGAATSDIYKGYQETTRFDPGFLTLGSTYYWRVDEVNGSDTWKGDVWSFVPTEAHGHLNLSVLDETTSESIPFMVRLTRLSDHSDAQPPNALQVSNLFEGNGTPGDRRDANLPRTLGGYTWCVPSGFVASLPIGQWEVMVRRGMEYTPIRQTVTIVNGQMTDKTIYPQQWVDMNANGWFAGDNHFHCRTIDEADADMIMQWAKAEDLNVVNALYMDNIKGATFTPRGFGPSHRIVDGNFAIVPGQEGPRTYDMGHVIGLNITSHVWNPDTYHCYDYVLDEFHAQGAVAGYAHAHAGAFNVHRDMSMNIPKEKIDFLEILEGGWLGTDRYYPWLNLGFKIAASAGSDVPWYGTMGEVRVYAHTGSSTLNVDDWYDAMRDGHTFVTNGPMIEFTVDGAIPGETINTTTNQLLHVHAKAWAWPEDFRPYRLEIIQHGNTIRSVEQVTPDQTELVIDFDVYSENGFWIAARVVEDPVFERGERVEAHTTPVYVQRNGLRIWKYNQVQQLLNDRESDLDDVETLIQLAHQTHDEGVNYLDYSDWEYQFRADRIIATESLLQQRIQDTRAIYDSLRTIYNQESSLR